MKAAFLLILLIPGLALAQSTTADKLLSCGMPPECVVHLGSSDWVPDQTATYDLGTSTKEWKDGFFSNALTANELTIEGGNGIELSDGNVTIDGGGHTFIGNTTGGGGACAGTFTCNGTTPVVISTSCYSADAMALFSLKTAGGTPGDINVTATTAGVSFTVTCEAGDTSVNNWMIFKHTS